MAIGVTMYQQIKQILLLLLFSWFSRSLFAQQKEIAEGLVQAGVILQDAGQVDSAIAKYHRALELDKNNLPALGEMAYSFLTAGKYEESIRYAKMAIKTHPGDPELQTVYVSYGNALDGLGKTGKAIDIYNEGIGLFPTYFQLYYNRGVSQNTLHQTEEAIRSFQKSVSLNPDHPGSHNAIGHILFNNNNIPALLAFCRYLVLEPAGRRAADNLENIQKIMGAHVTKSPEDRITVTISPDLLDTKKTDHQNNFSSAELMLALSSALDNDSSNINKTAVEKFIRKFSALCSFLKETEKNGYGFYWDYYVPYFIEMNDQGFVETFAYIAFSSSKTPDLKEWMEAHKTEIDHFYKWSKGFQWRIN